MALKKHIRILLAATGTALFVPGAAWAENLHSSPALMGPLGLNTVPSARMDKQGTITGGISTLDPYIHTWLGLQLADPLFINIRQSAEISNINDDADRLYPGVDLKLRLMKETKTRPALALGLQSAIGHKRMAGEYIALSKRYKDFDFTTGLGWGRFGTAAHFDNPLKSISSHFGGPRALDGEMPARPGDWFTGDHVGLFGGIEYHPPFAKGLSFKLDYGADRYSAEKTALDFEAPAPWAIGLNYKTPQWADLNGDLSIGMQGTDKIMARLSLSSNFKNWIKQDADTKSAVYMNPHRGGFASPAKMKTDAQRDKQILYATQTAQTQASTHVMLQEGLSLPRQIGWAAKHMANNGGHTIEALNITPTKMGLRGPQITLMRRDLEQAAGKHQGSSEEIWHNAEFTPQTQINFKKLQRPAHLYYGGLDWSAALDNQFSLSEEDSGTLYRTSAVLGVKGPTFFGLLDSALSLRINIKDNLEKITNLRPRAALPVRSNEDRFAKRTFGLDTQYINLTHSLRSDLHASLMGGYLEEMYGGFGGEILYRPFKSRWALGAESFIALKRDPETELNLGFNGDSLLTGHIQGWYDIPKWDLTMNARIGRYLAEDFGATLALQKTFRNGARLEGFVTLSDTADFDLFGGTTHSYHGLRMAFPLGGFKHIPRNVNLNIAAAPFGRDIGQTLKNPMPLYDLTEGFTLKHMAEYWDEIAE